jgi:hypothetical protein
MSISKEGIVFSLILSLLLSIPSLLAIEGQFVYQGDQVILQGQRVQVVPAQSSLAKEQVQELKAIGYQCDRRGQFYRCRKFLSSDEMLGDIVVSPQQDLLGFGPIKETEVITDAESLLQYKVRQDIQVGDQHYEQALYTLMRPSGLLKVSVPDANGPHYFLQRQSGEISELYEVRRRESRWAWQSYLLELFFHESH